MLQYRLATPHRQNRCTINTVRIPVLILQELMIAREIFTKTILSNSRTQDHTINPYVGYSRSCRYCYAEFMRRFTGHRGRWGESVDIKVDAQELPAR